jgi:hypothetical protein
MRHFEGLSKKPDLSTAAKKASNRTGMSRGVVAPTSQSSA